MLRSLKEILGYRLEATDGQFGNVRDFYFDDREWVVRYLVADTGKWLPGRKVLISPTSIGEPDWNARVVPVALTTHQIEQSPSIDDDKPVSRQQEEKLVGHYGWPAYWTPMGSPGVGMLPGQAVHPPDAGQPQVEHESEQEPEPTTAERGDPHLRSLDEICSYAIRASDGEIGHTEDLIVETDDWTIRYMVVDTRNWLPGRKVLLAPEWIERISWSAGEVVVQMTREKVKHSPEYDPSTPVNRAYEAKLYDYYGKPTR